MSKEHQQSKTEYQIRIDGVPKYYPNNMGDSAMETWAALCKEHPKCYVDIVRVDTQIIMMQFDYAQMKKHFKVSALHSVIKNVIAADIEHYRQHSSHMLKSVLRKAIEALGVGNGQS